LSTATIPVYYLDGAEASPNWRLIETNSYPTINTGSGRASWNELTGGNWQLTEVTNNDYVLAHIATTNDTDRPYIVFLGQQDYLSKGDARDGAETEINNLITEGLPVAEFKFLGTIILQTKDGFDPANTARVKIVSTNDGDDYIDQRGVIIGKSSSTSTATTHNGLPGLQGGVANEYYHLALETITKLTNIITTTSNSWVSGLEVTENSPKDQAILYGAGTYLIQAVTKTIASNGSVDLTSYHTDMVDDEHAYVLVYVDVDETVKTLRGDIASKGAAAFPPLAPDNTVCLANVEIRVDKNDNAKDIDNRHIADCRAMAVNSDEYAKVSPDDLETGYLADKLSDNGNVQFTIENPAGIETLRADAVPSVYYAESLNDSTINSDSYQNKLSMTETFGTGDYFIDVNYNWWSASDRNDFMSQVTLDGNLIGVEHLEEIKEKTKTQYVPASRRFKVSLSGSQTINLDYKSSTLELSTVGINSAMITVTKINIL